MKDVFYIGLQKAGTEFIRSYLDFLEIDWGYDSLKIFGASNFDELIKNVDVAEFISKIQVWEGLATSELTHDGVWTGNSIKQSSIAIDNFELIIQRIISISDNPKFIISIRRQDFWLLSNYYHFYFASGSQFRGMKNFIKTSEGQSLLLRSNYFKIYELLLKYTDRDNILFIPLEKLASDETAVLTNLCSFIGVQFKEFVGKRKYNNSYSRERIGFSEALTQVLPIKIADRIAINSPKLILKIVKNTIRNKEIESLTTSKDILVTFKESNKKLDHKLQLGLSRFDYY